MAINKYRITGEEFAALPENERLFYVPDGGGYRLPLTDYSDPTPLQTALARERQQSTERQQRIEALTGEVTTLRQTTPQDVRALQQSHERLIGETKQQYDARIKGVREQLEATLLRQAVGSLATDLTANEGNASVITPHVQNRLAVEWEGDVATIRVRNSDGTLGSALSPESRKALVKEFVDNPTYSSIIVKSRATGGGAAGAPTGNSGSAGAGPKKKLADMNGAERNALYTENPAEFQRLKAAQDAERLERITQPQTLKFTP